MHDCNLPGKQRGILGKRLACGTFNHLDDMDISLCLGHEGWEPVDMHLSYRSVIMQAGSCQGISRARGEQRRPLLQRFQEQGVLSDQASSMARARLAAWAFP